MTINQIKSIAKNVDANAVRYILKDYNEFNCVSHCILDNVSTHWEQGVPTDTKLPGLCFLLVDTIDRDYYYDKLLFIYAEEYETGTDEGEIIVKNPYILHTANKPIV